MSNFKVLYLISHKPTKNGIIKLARGIEI